MWWHNNRRSALAYAAPFDMSLFWFESGKSDNSSEPRKLLKGTEGRTGYLYRSRRNTTGYHHTECNLCGIGFHSQWDQRSGARDSFFITCLSGVENCPVPGASSGLRRVRIAMQLQSSP